MRRRSGRRGSGEGYVAVAVPPAPGRREGADAGPSRRDAAVGEAPDEHGTGAILPDGEGCVASGRERRERPTGRTCRRTRSVRGGTGSAVGRQPRTQRSHADGRGRRPTRSPHQASPPAACRGGATTRPLPTSGRRSPLTRRPWPPTAATSDMTRRASRGLRPPSTSRSSSVRSRPGSPGQRP